MKLANLRFVRALSAVLAVLLVLPGLFSLSTSPARAAETPEMKRALLATVSIMVPIDGDKDRAVGGSGSMLTSDGYVLTNMHVMADLENGAALWNAKGLAAISLNSPNNLHALPVLSYVAQLVKGDPDLDLAVLKIIAYANKKGELPKDLGLVTMPLGDSDKIEFGDGILCFGYPGLGGDTVTFTRGTVAGFADDNRDGKTDWIKTDAQVNHGNSGGAATNDKGEMIGVPTEVRSDPQLAGRISYIRPVALARPLVEAALSGVSDEPGLNTDGPGVGNFIFSSGVDRKGKPVKAVTRFDSGAKSIYAIFDFNGFEDGLSFGWQWQRDGKQVYEDSADWDQGTSGSAWVSLSDDSGLADGTYQLVLSLHGQRLGSARIRVGKEVKPQSAPQFGSPTFAEGATDSDEPVKPHKAGQPFAEGSKEVYAFMDYKNMAEGTPFSYRWLIDGEEVLANDAEWQGSAGNGQFWLQINSKNGLPGGHYRLETAINGQSSASGEFDLGGKANAADEGVQVTAVILDADSKRAISGAVFIALIPGTDPEAFIADPLESDIYASGTADRQGRLTLDKPLERGQAYTFVMAAKGYQPAIEEDFPIDQDTETPLELTVRLQKR